MWRSSKRVLNTLTHMVASFARRSSICMTTRPTAFPKDLQHLTRSGGYQHDLDSERVMVVGGSATVWQAITLRMLPQDFKTRTLYGYGDDWPLAYDDLEPYYGKAEALLGVSGTDADNPFAPKRSSPYPLPPFALGYDDAIFAERLRHHGIVMHTTPQARTRAAYEERPGCMNFGTCRVCPIGARYSPNYHLLRAIATGRCSVHANTSVRRLVVDGTGRARALVYQGNDEATAREHGAKVIIVAAGTLESARLLLLSASERHPDGLGNDGGHVGQHLTLHHLWSGRLHYTEHFQPGRFGGIRHGAINSSTPRTAASMGVVIDFSSQLFANEVMFRAVVPEQSRTGSEVVEWLNARRQWRDIVMQTESAPGPQKYVTRSTQRDRFGDPYVHVHYEATAFDHETYRFGRELFDRVMTATGADEGISPARTISRPATITWARVVWGTACGTASSTSSARSTAPLTSSWWVGQLRQPQCRQSYPDHGRAGHPGHRIYCGSALVMSHVRRTMAVPAPPPLRAIASALALALICVPLTMGALWAFPIWDDAWFWLLLNEHGTGAIVTTWVDRPIMAAVWSLLAPTEPAFWRASLGAGAPLAGPRHPLSRPLG